MDFRYNKALGGGALMDAGGYVVKLATLLLGDTIRLCGAKRQVDEDYKVDVFDTVMFSNNEGLVYQGAFGMDCHYQCTLEIWGSRGKLITNRIFTSPTGYSPSVIIEDKAGQELLQLNPDKHFKNSIEVFKSAIKDVNLNSQLKEELLLQSKLISEIKARMGSTNE